MQSHDERMAGMRLCWQGALADLDAVLRLDPQSGMALATRADVKRLLGDHEVSRTIYTLQHNPVLCL